MHSADFHRKHFLNQQRTNRGSQQGDRVALQTQKTENRELVRDGAQLFDLTPACMHVSLFARQKGAC